MYGMAMDDLFSASTRERSFKNAPLAVRMRPNSLDEYVGQQKAVGKGSWLRAAIEHDVLSSVILYGPAGTGKTTLAHIIANHTKSEFVEVSAVTGTVKDLRRVIDEAKTRLNTYDRRTILFIDEIHRFSKSQLGGLSASLTLRVRLSRAVGPAVTVPVVDVCHKWSPFLSLPLSAFPIHDTPPRIKKAAPKDRLSHRFTALDKSHAMPRASRDDRGYSEHAGTR